jgi:hypothetical protein
MIHLAYVVSKKITLLKLNLHRNLSNHARLDYYVHGVECQTLRYLSISVRVFAACIAVLSIRQVFEHISDVSLVGFVRFYELCICLKSSVYNR